MRILGLDIGDKRIGIAVSDKLEIISTPLEVFNNDKKVKEKLQKLINEYKIKKIVVGIGFIEAPTITGSPLVIPPSIPPALLVFL